MFLSGPLQGLLTPTFKLGQTSQVKGIVLHKAALSDIRGGTGVPQVNLTSHQLATIQLTTPQVREFTTVTHRTQKSAILTISVLSQK